MWYTGWSFERLDDQYMLASNLNALEKHHREHFFSRFMLMQKTYRGRGEKSSWKLAKHIKLVKQFEIVWQIC